MWKPIFEITILWFVIYNILSFFEGTRAVQVLRGIIIVLAAFLLFQLLNLEVLSWLMKKLFGISVIAILVIFHPEIRHGLALLGQRQLFGTALREEEIDNIIKQVVNAAEALSKEKIGALIALEKNDPLSTYIESGVSIDSCVSSDIIQTIFTPNSMLHDGGVVIRHGRISAAGCLFPINQDQDLSRVFGTRHRAALGLSEETDALVVIVSEERQDMSFAYKGKLYKDLSREEMISKLKTTIKSKENNG